MASDDATATGENSVLLRSLGDVASSLTNTFCCGGRLKQQSIRLKYGVAESDKKAGEINLPLDTQDADAALLALQSAGSVASFGMGTEQITDLNYRNAYKIDPDDFFTSFQLCNTPILNDIETLLVPKCNFRAELHKLNIYTGPDGHFKSHVDTPRSSEMFGSLVVCLPTQFTGGTLIARHNGKETVFDWSSTSQDPLKTICWAAFFSDVEHEILPVTSGVRLTLTYNLYSLKERPLAVPTTCPFFQLLRNSLDHPHFLRSGGCLGFDCKHMYVFTQLNEIEMLPNILKGADYLVYSAAKSLGVKVTVQPIVDEECKQYLLPKFSNKFGVHRSMEEGRYGDKHCTYPRTHRFNDGTDTDDIYHGMKLETLESMYAGLEQSKLLHNGVKWCRPSSTWKDVFDLIQPGSLKQATVEMLEEKVPTRVRDIHLIENDENSSVLLETAGVCKEDIYTINAALKQLHANQRISQAAGIFTAFGNEAAHINVCYQSAVILVEVPCWGEPPRGKKEDSAEKRSGGIAGSSGILYWVKGKN